MNQITTNSLTFSNVSPFYFISGMLLVLTTLIGWLPYFIVHSCNLDQAPSHALEVFTMWLAYLNALMDPIVYTVLNKKIRSVIGEQFGMIISCLTFSK